MKRAPYGLAWPQGPAPNLLCSERIADILGLSSLTKLIETRVLGMQVKGEVKITEFCSTNEPDEWEVTLLIPLPLLLPSSKVLKGGRKGGA